MAEALYIERIADHYRREGYEVRAGPAAEPLPSFLGGFRPDLIAQADADHVVVAVRSRKELAVDAELTFAATAITAEPGWRLDVFVGGEDDWVQPWAEATEPTDADIDAMLRSARRLLALGEIGSAYLIGWAAAEATLRAVARANGLQASTRDASGVIQSLQFEGLLNDGEVAHLEGVLGVRNALAHGLRTKAATDSALSEMLDVTAQLTHELARPAA